MFVPSLSWQTDHFHMKCGFKCRFVLPRGEELGVALVVAALAALPPVAAAGAGAVRGVLIDLAAALAPAHGGVHTKLQAEGVDALAQPRHAVRVARRVDHEVAVAVAALGAVAAVERDVLVPSDVELVSHDLGDAHDDGLVEVVAAAG